jgi:hypothetical protein
MDHILVSLEGKYTNDRAEVAKQGFKALMDGKDYPSQNR